ncbi:MAG: dTMP kinase [Kiloniellaceae bacterium]
MARGRFITIEGGEGAGKSTQIELLAAALARAGIAVRTTREPGGSPGAEEIRKLLVTGAADRWDPLAEALLHFAARRVHLRAVVLPELAAGTWVLSDRFADSTMAYQGYGHGLGRAEIERLYALVVGDFAPDLTVILDLPVELGLRRAAGRRSRLRPEAFGGRAGEDRYERMDRAFHDRLRAGFREIARREPRRCVLIDAAGEVEAVHGAVLAAVSARLGLALT